MKNKSLMLSALLLISAFSFVSAQQVNTLPNNGTGQNPNAYVGIGTAQDLQVPNQNLQIHGRLNYTRQGNGNLLLGLEGQTQGSPSTLDYGVTSAISLTNTVTGLTRNDGAIIRMSQQHFTIDNLEQGGNIILAANGANMTFQGATKRIYTGGTFFSIANQAASFNIFAAQANGLSIKTSTGGYAGLTISTGNNNDFAFQVYGTDAVKNFLVRTSGEVYARKYTTTLNNMPDYVFEPSYKLMSFEDLRKYLTLNKHLPNIPSATEFAEKGVDLGELVRLLLEKNEEQVLYILQLEERIKKIEQGL